MRLELSTQETSLLREILASDLDELYREIARTDTRDFREQLKERATRLEALVEKFGSATQPAAYA